MNNQNFTMEKLMYRAMLANLMVAFASVAAYKKLATKRTKLEHEYYKTKQPYLKDTIQAISDTMDIIETDPAYEGIRLSTYFI